MRPVRHGRRTIARRYRNYYTGERGGQSDGGGSSATGGDSEQKIAWLSLRVADEDGNPLSAGDSSSRTALPSLSRADFSSFTLMGSSNNGFDWEQIWASGDTANAYAELTAAKIGVTEGFWVFRLFAFKGGAKYSGYTERTEVVAGRENALSFTLSLNSLGADEANSTGGMSVTVAFSESRVAKVTAELRSLNGTAVLAEEEITVSGSGTKTATYAKSGIAAGTYAVVFRFYATDTESGESILLGSWVEYAGIASGVTSVSNDMAKNTIESLDSTYSITYNYNGGSLASGQTAQGSYSRHASATLPTEAQVSRTGYTFAGWYDNSSLTGTAVTHIPADSTGARSFWAKWNPAPYTVCYHKNTSASDTAANSTQTLTYDANGTLKTLSSLGWSRTDATFVGWATSANASAAAYTDGQSGTLNLTGVPNGTADLYAVWKYTVSFNGNKGSAHSTAVSGSTAAQTVTGYATNLALAANGFTHAGYTFAGWNTKADGTGTSYAAGSGATFSANTTLYARWAANTYTVTVSTGWAKSQTTTTTVTATFDAALPKLTTTNPPSNHPAALGSFKRSGYTLEGFYDAATGGTKYYDASGNSVKSWDKTSAATLYAHWTALGTVLTSGSTSGMGLVDAVYVFSQDLSFTTGTAGDSGITIGAASVSFYIEEGVTVTATGKAGANAGNGANTVTAPGTTSGSSHSNTNVQSAGGSGGGGGGAGVHVPSGRTLNIYGYGTIKATGGNGGNAGNGGGNVRNASFYFSGPEEGWAATGGAGGGGAGGGGAGIGTPGASGGAGGNGGSGGYARSISYDARGNSGAAGANGSSAASCGTINIASTITKTVSAGNGGSAGSGGGAPNTSTSSLGHGSCVDYRVDDRGSDWSNNYTGGSGGTGGGGAGGYAGAAYGTGGAGGGGGGGAAGGSIDKAKGDHKYRGGGYGHGGTGNGNGGDGSQESFSSEYCASGAAGGSAIGGAGTSASVGSL